MPPRVEIRGFIGRRRGRRVDWYAGRQGGFVFRVRLFDLIPQAGGRRAFYPDG
jgi:hypothetical protein